MSKELVFSPEQEQVIYSREDILLSAGAGSGKTFVIIHHLLSLIEDELNKEFFNEIEFENYLKKICVITFTIKAAKELVERIKVGIKSKLQEDSRWDVAYKNIDKIFVGTIHSLCFHLLKDQGILFFDAEIMGQLRFHQKLESLYERFSWAQQRKDLFLHKKYFLNMLKSIVSNSVLRKSLLDNDEKLSNEFFYEDFFDLVNIDFTLFSKFETKWGELIPKIQECIESRKFKSLQELFEVVKRLPALKKEEKTDENIELSLEIKNFKKQFSEFNKIILSFEEYSNKFDDFLETIKALNKFVDKQYWKDSLITYDDLEYLSISNLDKFSNYFQKVIVDEYQDLSWSQYHIIKHMSSKARKLFVGDHKQAIYGFRGGDLGVYSKTSKEVDKHLVLKDNYRSTGEVIKFNNDFFSQMIKDYLPQSAPLETSIGFVTMFKSKVFDDAKLSSQNLNNLEVNYLIQQLRVDLDDPEIESIAVIYRFLGPSVKLFKQLIKNNLPVKISVKTALREDPILNLFKSCLKFFIYEKDHSRRRSVIAELEILFECLDIERNELNLEANLLKYLNSSRLIGLYSGFLSFLRSIGLTTVKLSDSLSLIKEMIHLSKENYHGCLDLLKSYQGERGIQHIESLEGDKYVEIISAHSSKGLEFDSVYVAGSMTNGRSKQSQKLIYQSLTQVKFLNGDSDLITTPDYYLEYSKAKEVSLNESYRLLYVAATRAKLKLNFYLIDHDKTKFDKNSWASAFELYQLEDLVDKVQEVETHNYLKNEAKPLFHEFDLVPLGTPQTGISLLPDLSVAKLSKLVLCPYKFYLDEVLKFSDKNIDSFVADELMVESIKDGISSAERGLEIHAKVESMVRNIDLIQESEIASDLKYVYNEIKKYKNAKLFPEHEMRFELKGYTISGRADLIIQNNTTLEIWDYKTGLDIDEEAYFAQLALYAHAMGKKHKSEEIILKVVYLDLNETRQRSFIQKDIDDQVDQILNLLNNLSHQNLDYCRHCELKTLCQPKTDLLGY